MADLRVTPGRAGRMRLRRSLDAAARGADLLDRKLRILRARHEELLRAERDGAQRWRQQLREAETWLRRGLLLGGEDALDVPGAGQRAAVDVSWTSTMGVRHPASAVCAVPERDPDAPAPANTALARAESAYAEAVRAAAQYGAARAAARALGEEVLTTRRRTRALRRQWIPRLEDALCRTDALLEQAEHEDAVRRRWAAGLSDADGT
ncbi:MULTISPECIES: V-type ATP synthase subunit D [unclassified Streptomyces]|uniref:V-type ATP synthase subunit D n=1 Tax=unclassified Streptomyces TaxID=2593676 RepID=UPI001F035189|nr:MULTISPECIES: V-type ATP synthase subunit D [unclassified Streptomyces]MCH0566674.1 V-type ATPase, D subunit [Streptomyces sp. MUM 2J]MCH0572232.1 V-type ATPase, D subunit [Streptomyces sp. MUM 136J]